MTFIYGGAACGMGIYYKSYSVMHIICQRIVPQYVLNVQFCGLMTFIYGGVACGMGISSEKGTIGFRQQVSDSANYSGLMVCSALRHTGCTVFYIQNSILFCKIVYIYIELVYFSANLRTKSHLLIISQLPECVKIFA